MESARLFAITEEDCSVLVAEESALSELFDCVENMQCWRQFMDMEERHQDSILAHFVHEEAASTSVETMLHAEHCQKSPSIFVVHGHQSAANLSADICEACLACEFILFMFLSLLWLNYYHFIHIFML